MNGMRRHGPKNGSNIKNFSLQYQVDAGARGTIDDVTQGILTLKGCSFLKPLETK